MFSLSKILTLFSLCAFFDEVTWIDDPVAPIVINLSLFPYTILLQLLKTYTARSKRLAPVGYLTTGVICLLSIVVIVIEGIESEPYSELLRIWGHLIIKCLVIEIFIFDTIRAVFNLIVYRKIIEHNEHIFEKLID
jgi:hypothetical protein